MSKAEHTLKEKVEHILNGWINYIGGSDPITYKIAKQRAEICAECPIKTYGLHAAVLPDFQMENIQGYFCDKTKGGCNCPLSTIVRSKNYKCPQEKW